MQLDEQVGTWQVELEVARKFLPSAPYDAVARIRSVLAAIDGALALPEGRSHRALHSLRLAAALRLRRYEASYARWLHEAAQREARFESKEMRAIVAALPPKP